MRKISYLSMIVLSFYSCNFINIFSAGSYAYAEEYSLTIYKEDLIKIINKFRKENNFKECNSNIKEGKKTEHDWYYLHFCVNNNKIYSVMIRYEFSLIKFQYVSKVFLIGIYKNINDLNEYNIPKDYFEINKDLTYSENKKELDEFERLILEPIKERVKEFNKKK